MDFDILKQLQSLKKYNETIEFLEKNPNFQEKIIQHRNSLKYFQKDITDSKIALKQYQKFFNTYELSFFEKPIYEDIKTWNTLIDSAISTYQNTANEEIEVKIEMQSKPIILKRNLINEYIEMFKNLKIPDNIAVKLGFISYILLRLSPLIYIIPALIPVVNALLKIFITYGSAYIQELQQFEKPEYFAQKALENTFSMVFSFVISIIISLFFTKNKK